MPQIGAFAQRTRLSGTCVRKPKMASHELQVALADVHCGPPPTCQRHSRSRFRRSIHLSHWPDPLPEHPKTDTELSPKSSPCSGDSSLLRKMGKREPDQVGTEFCGASANHAAPTKGLCGLAVLAAHVCHGYAIAVDRNWDAAVPPVGSRSHPSSCGHRFPELGDICGIPTQHMLQKRSRVVFKQGRKHLVWPEHRCSSAHISTQSVLHRLPEEKYHNRVRDGCEARGLQDPTFIFSAYFFRTAHRKYEVPRPPPHREHQNCHAWAHKRPRLHLRKIIAAVLKISRCMWLGYRPPPPIPANRLGNVGPGPILWAKSIAPSIFEKERNNRICHDGH